MDDHQYCARCGISLFDTLSGARRAYRRFSEKVKAYLGYTHIAKGYLDERDGWMKSIDGNGHFTFYEHADAALETKFTIIEQL
ncbi:hypothetical protein ACQKLP_15380 [Chitinophaga sp. NPDC101104]|uniref:hypothetical protein n=1 Tax=Chitinophaga sp. NPDC101104 TaxID=3390561 RepID=UPI003D01466C